MAIELTEAQMRVLAETAPVATREEFRVLLDEAAPEMIDIFETHANEVERPNQPIPMTLTELRDLYLVANDPAYAAALAERRFGPERVALLRGSVRLLATAHLWFGEGNRAGLYRPKTAAETIEASRPWREAIRRFANQAFVRDRKLKDEFADANSSRTIEEEEEDLRSLNALIQKHLPELIEFGLTDELVAKGKELLAAVEQRQLLGVLGIRSFEEALHLRNQLLTYAIFMAEEARAAGENAFVREPQRRRRFEAISFRNAARRFQGGRRRPGDAEDAAPAAPADAGSGTGAA
jgi:hypothetical protein